MPSLNDNNQAKKEKYWKIKRIFTLEMCISLLCVCMCGDYICVLIVNVCVCV